MAHSKRFLSALILLTSLTLPALSAADRPKPKIRAITGFITIDPKSYPSQIEATVKFLSQVREAIKTAGFEVAGIRISTQPFPDYTVGLSHADALKLLRGIDDLAAKLRFAPNIGPAMSKDTDGSEPVDLLIDVLSMPGNRLNANIVTAGADGIHWNAVRQAARIIKTVGERSPHGQGNFNFAAIAMLKPYGPFYPGAWHPGGGPRSFAIGRKVEEDPPPEDKLADAGFRPQSISDVLRNRFLRQPQAEPKQSLAASHTGADSG